MVIERSNMTKNERIVNHLKIEIFDILERQEILNHEHQRLDQLKREKLEKLNNIRNQMKSNPHV